MIRGLRPVDTVMFLFYLVLLALGIVADVRNAIWFVPLGLSVVCAILWFVARRQLGVAFSVRPEAHQLVTTGFYAKLRPPSTPSARWLFCSSCWRCRAGRRWSSGPF